MVKECASAIFPSNRISYFMFPPCFEAPLGFQPAGGDKHVAQRALSPWSTRLGNVSEIHSDTLNHLNFHPYTTAKRRLQQAFKYQGKSMENAAAIRCRLK